MKTTKKFLSLFVMVCLAVSCFVGCQPAPDTTAAPTEPVLPEFVDYVEQVKLDIKDSGKSIFTEETPAEQRENDRKKEEAAKVHTEIDPDDEIDMLFESAIK